MKPHLWRRSPAGKYLRHLPRIKHMRGTWLHRKLGDRVIDPDLWRPSRMGIARGLAIGMFFSMIPVPLQTIPSVFLACIMRVNVPAAIVGVWISNPITTPIILYGQYKLGQFLMRGTFHAPAPAEGSGLMDMLARAPVQIMLGALITGVICGLVGYFGGGWIWDWVEKAMHRHHTDQKKKKETASVRKMVSTPPED